MLWLNPIAWFALATAALPLLIHLLIQRRVERFPFPTLRFLQPTRLAAVRRHLLEDLPLLAVRIALLAAAAAALAGPLLVTAARRHAWDRRVVRAVVTDSGTASSAALQQTFAAEDLRDGIRRAILWLDAAPPARREILVSSAFPIGSITAADVAAIPAGIGVRFERTGSLPRTRTVAGGRVLTADGTRAREVTLDGERTSVHETAANDRAAWPIAVVASKQDQGVVDAATAAVLSQRVWAGPPDRRARVFLIERPESARGRADAAQGPAAEVARGSSPATGSVIVAAWMADAVSRIAADRDLRAAAGGVAAGMADAGFAAAPWQTIAAAADGRPLVVASASTNEFFVVSAAPASDVVTPVLLRAIADAIAAPPDLQRAEVVPIADAVLQRWSRPAAPVTSPRIDTVDGDDRRWLWLAALLLMAVEMWIRRARTADRADHDRQEDARVA